MPVSIGSAGSRLGAAAGLKIGRVLLAVEVLLHRLGDEVVEVGGDELELRQRALHIHFHVGLLCVAAHSDHAHFAAALEGVAEVGVTLVGLSDQDAAEVVGEVVFVVQLPVIDIVGPDAEHIVAFGNVEDYSVVG